MHARHDTLVLALPNSIGAEQGHTLAANHLIEPGDDRRRMALRPREARVHRLVWKG